MIGQAVGSRAHELVAAAGAVSSPPLIYEKLMRVINDPRSGASDVAAVITEDQGLTVRLLKVVNSAFFSLPCRCDSVSTAVRVVGTGQIRDLAIATSVITLFKDVPEDLLDLESFWHHSLGTGVVARVLAKHRRENNVERFLVAGLLHDIGRLIMVTQAPAEMTAALAEARTIGKGLSECELEHVGCTHAHVGGVLLDQWNFAPALQEAVRYHHLPARATRFPAEAGAVHVADIVSNALGWGRSGQVRAPALDVATFAALGIEMALVPAIIEDAQRQLEAALHLVVGASGR